MKFSVVIPLYNKEHYIEATIQSVLNQTCQNFEVLVVDDGSKDNSLALARKFESDRVRVIPQENQGVSVARNSGILNALNLLGIISALRTDQNRGSSLLLRHIGRMWTACKDFL